MAFFGKLVASEREPKRQRPLQLLPVNNSALLHRFEKTLVGRIFNLEAQENRVKALLAFLPSVWKCEGRVQGLEMGRGRFHVRFQEEDDLIRVLDNRPYHFDGWMLALERWVPTVRLDFPSSIPFWIRIMDLPDIYNEEKQVRRIGEDLGEVLNWNLEDPIPMIQVLLECDAPIAFFRDTASEGGEIFRIRFEYLKLHGHCKSCFRLTHDTRSCPSRVAVGTTRRRENQREPARNREVGRDRRGRRIQQGGYDQFRGDPEQLEAPTEAKAVSSLKRRPVRRNLAEELGASNLSEQEKGEAHGSTKEWVQRSFGVEREIVPTQNENSGKQASPKRSAALDTHSNTWYRRSEEEAAAVNRIYDQNDRWEKAEGGHRKSERVEQEIVSGKKGAPATVNSGRGNLPDRSQSGKERGLPAKTEGVQAPSSRRHRREAVDRARPPIPSRKVTGETRRSTTGPPNSAAHDVCESGPPYPKAHIEVPAQKPKGLHEGLDQPNKEDGPEKSLPQEGEGPEWHTALPTALMGLPAHLDATDVISPLKELVGENHQIQINGPRDGTRLLGRKPRLMEQRIRKALAVKKKIQHSPFRGSRIQKHASLALEDPLKRVPALVSASIPSPEKTGLTNGQISRNFKDPVVKGKPPAGT